MLPILRIIPVGGVSLAILILVLALAQPGGSRPGLTPAMVPARGPLIARGDHPEWRQLFIAAALRRAEELSELRLLPDTQMPGVVNEPDKAKAEPKPPEVAGVPANQNDVQPEDITGTVQSPATVLPVDIGETSSFELPVSPHEEQPPVIRTPERGTPRHESRNVVPPELKPEPAKAVAEINRKPEPETRRKIVHNNNVHRARATPKSPEPFGLLQAFLESFRIDQQPAKSRR